MCTLGKAVQFPQAPLSVSLVSFAASAASAVAMALRLVLNSIRSVSSRAKFTSQEISSLILSSSRRINNNLTNKIFVRRYCHHLDDDRKPPLENIERRKIYAQRTPTPVSFGVYYQKTVIDTALFAVNVHNQKENAQLQFVRALKADYIPMGGMKLYITLEVQNAGKFEVYRTVVFYKPWKNYRDIKEWERVEDHPFPCNNCFD